MSSSPKRSQRSTVATRIVSREDRGVATTRELAELTTVCVPCCTLDRLNRPKFERVLLPRTSGLQIILDAVADVKPDIYDLTIAFPTYSGEVPTFEMGYGRKTDTRVPSMKSLLAGQGPPHVAIHAKKYAYDDAMQGLEQFLDERWQEKEERLNYFITHQKFPVQKGEDVSELALPVRPSDCCWLLRRK